MADEGLRCRCCSGTCSCSVAGRPVEAPAVVAAGARNRVGAPSGKGAPSAVSYRSWVSRRAASVRAVQQRAFSAPGGGLLRAYGVAAAAGWGGDAEWLGRLYHRVRRLPVDELGHEFAVAYMELGRVGDRAACQRILGTLEARVARLERRRLDQLAARVHGHLWAARKREERRVQAEWGALEARVRLPRLRARVDAMQGRSG